MKQMSWVVLSLAMLQGCQQGEGITPPAPLTVSTVTVTESVASQYRRFNGQVDAAELTPLAFRVEGELKQITVRTGQRVTQGQTLAVLDADKFDQQLRDAKVQFELATKQLQRGRELHSRNMVSNAELDELIANQRLTQVQYASAKARVGYTHLTAPFNGVVAEVPKEAFEAVTPGETVVSLYQDDRVYINIPVSDTVIAMINPQVRGRGYQPMAYFGAEQTGYPVSYREHTSELAPQSQTYRMWFDMPQREPAILPGTSVTLNVDMTAAGLSTQQGYMLPLLALDAGQQPGQFFVWKWVDGEVQRVAVQVEKINSQGAIVSRGVEQGDRLVTSSLRKLRDGMAVALQPAASSFTASEKQQMNTVTESAQ